MRLDQAAPLEFPEKIERAIGKAMAVAVVAVGPRDAVVAPDMLNAPALRKAVQHALLQFRDIHGRCLSSRRTPRMARMKAHAFRVSCARQTDGRSADDDNLLHIPSAGRGERRRCTDRRPRCQRRSSTTSIMDSWTGYGISRRAPFDVAVMRPIWSSGVACAPTDAPLPE